MGLIKCPECGKDISDKSDKCIHCGYPLKPKSICILNGVERDLSFLIDGSCDFFECVIRINAMTGSCFETSCGIIDDIQNNNEIPKILNIKTKQEYLEEKNRIKCAKCGCTEFVPLRKKWSIFSGFASNKIEMVCKNCGAVRK